VCDEKCSANLSLCNQVHFLNFGCHKVATDSKKKKKERKKRKKKKKVN